MTVGPWRPAFDNWVEMAERYQYRYELVGLEVAEPYVAHATKWRLLSEYFADLPRDRLVFHLDAADAFVCDVPAEAVTRYREYGTPLVLGAEQGRHANATTSPTRRGAGRTPGDTSARPGSSPTLLREGYELEDWESHGRVSDQHAMNLYLRLPGNEHLATVDHRRTIVRNVSASRAR